MQMNNCHDCSDTKQFIFNINVSIFLMSLFKWYYTVDVTFQVYSMKNSCDEFQTFWFTCSGSFPAYRRKLVSLREWVVQHFLSSCCLFDCTLMSVLLFPFTLFLEPANLTGKHHLSPFPMSNTAFYHTRPSRFRISLHFLYNCINILQIGHSLKLIL